MPRKNIAVATVQAASWQTELQAQLDCFVCLDTEEDASNAEDILRLVKEEHLWIVRSGGCRMNISLLVHGQIVYGAEAVASLADWIQELEVGRTIQALLDSYLHVLIMFIDMASTRAHGSILRG